MRNIVVAVALVAAHPAHADPVPFPVIDPGPLCEQLAERAPNRLKGLLEGAGAVVDAEKVKETARAGCLTAQEEGREQVRAMWDQAPDTLRRTCQANASYPEVALCLLQGER
jgi:hypothetical protein